MESMPVQLPPLSLDKNGLLEYQKNRPPFLMMDYAVEVVPGQSAKGYKDLAANEWFFECHFPGDPTMPGMLQLEAIVQMCALSIFTLPGNKGKVAYLASAKSVKFKRRVLPGERLVLDTKLHSWKRGIGQCSGIASVQSEIACEAEFTLVLPDELTLYSIAR